jgi:hypothetical protein
VGARAPAGERDVTEVAARLEALRERVDRVSVEPDAIHMPVTRFARSLLRFVGAFRVDESKTEALRDLLDAIPKDAVAAEDLTKAVAAPLAAALDELEEDIARSEKAIVVHRALPSGHATWLARRLRALARVAGAMAADGGSAAALARGIRPIDVAPPLGVRPAAAPAPSPADAEKADAASRLVALQIAAIDHVADAARSETAVLARRRRLFEAARRLLLDAASTLPLDAAGVDVRTRAIAEEIVAIDRVEAAGVDPRVGLVHQARNALADGDQRRLHAALVALEGAAVRAGDGGIASTAARALRPFWRKGGRHGDAALRSSEEASADEAFGDSVTTAIKSVAEASRKKAREVALGKSEGEKELARLLLEYLTPGAASDTTRVMLAADGMFDVGGTLSPVRIVEHETIARVVRHPTSSMVLVRATEPLDVMGAVIEDPRLVWLSLAAGGLLTRKFVAQETREHTRTGRQGEVRVYVLDGSGSMLRGDASRARMRDALLLCELSTLLRRVTEGGARTRVTLHYGFFNRELGGLHRVATADEAIAAIGDVVGNARRGGTDIQKALLASFDIVREARAADSDLARGQIVLVTDGESPVDEAVVEEARRAVGDVPVGLSVIALGEENTALRGLVARQRAAGERAFYHFIPDGTLSRLVEGEASSWLGSLHAPKAAPSLGAATKARAAIEDALAELADLEQTRHQRAIGGNEPDATEGDVARAENLRGERRALARRFARWFGDGTEPSGAELLRPSEDATDVDAIRMVLGTVAEVLSELGGKDDARLVDAIDLAERLVREARITPGRYEELVTTYAGAFAVEREAVRTIARPWGDAPRIVET